MLGNGSIRERIRESLWFWPLVTVVVSSALGAILTVARPLEGSALDGVMVHTEAAQLHSLLATLLAAMITAASIIASLTIVALQTASTQFSPRLLRNFVRDATTQAVMASFMGTAAYLISVFVLVGDETPRLAVTMAMAGVFASVMAIAFFFNHVSQSIRAETIVKVVAEETLESARRLADWLGGANTSFESFDGPPVGAVAIPADRSGYVQQIDVGALAELSAQRRVDIWLAPQLGQWVLEGTALAWCVPSRPDRGPAVPLGSVDGAFVRSVCDDLELGYERTMHHDAALGIRQLVDIANKAMSPAVNDPYTATQAIDHLGPILAGLGQGRLGDHVVTGVDGVGWVAVPGTTFSELAALATDQIRRVGAREPAVALRLVALLGDVAAVVDAVYHDDLLELVERVLADARREIVNSQDLAEVEAGADEVLASFDRAGRRAVSRRDGL